MATSSYIQYFISDGTNNGTLTVGDSSGFQVGSTVFLAAEGERIRRVKVTSKPTSTRIIVAELNDDPFDASEYTVARNARVFQPKSSIIIPHLPVSGSFYSGTVSRTATISVANNPELVLNADVGNSLVVRKSGVEKAAIDKDGYIYHSGMIRSNVADATNASAHIFDTQNPYTQGTLMSFRNGGEEILYITSNGSIVPQYENPPGLVESTSLATLGNTARRWDKLYVKSIWDSVFERIKFETNGPDASSIYTSGHSTSGVASWSVAHNFYTRTTFSAAGSKLVSISNGNTEKAYFDKDGKLVMDPGDSTTSPGNATVNKPSGRSAIASGSSSVTITNSIVAESSIVLVTMQTEDGSNFIKSVAPANGSFTVTLNASAGVNVNFCWVVH
ncbi:hypothetical protein EBZ39_06920 [bacterium]|nr:hypothetical protein [bacterium]